MQQNLNEPAHRVVGVRQVLRAVAEDTLSCVYIARDADPFITKPVMDACQKARIRLIEVDTMAGLGAECGIDVKASVAGLFR